MVKTFEMQKLLCVRENVQTYDADMHIKCSDELVLIARKLGIDNAAEEYFYLICLNARGKVIAVHEVSHGDVTSSLSHPREVFKRAMLNNATSVALIHNHPSGEPNISESDIEATQRLCESGKLLGVPVIDHIIIGGDEYESMKAKCLI